MALMTRIGGVQRIIRVKVRVKVRSEDAQVTKHQGVTAGRRYTGKAGQKLGATPVLGALGRPEPTPLASAASGVAPNFCPARRPATHADMKSISRTRRAPWRSSQEN